MHDLNKDLLKDKILLNGEWQLAGSGAHFDVHNPFNNEKIGKVPDCSKEDFKQAIKAAQGSFKNWRDKTAGERAKILERWHDLIIENQEDLARIMTAEQGKPLKESRGEIAYAAGFIKWFAEEGRRIYGDIIPSHQTNSRILTLKQPVGVCAAITPWNFPAAMITRKAGAALAAGCTFIVKPASETPFSALALGVLAGQAGLPDGVLNILTTSNAKMAGDSLTDSQTVQKISFTGSTEVGRELYRKSADTVKKISLELGGNAPFIVFEDADIDKAIEGALNCKFRNAGQTCVCANRIFVHKTIYEEFCARLTEKVQKLNIGDGFSEHTDIGPLISEKAVDKVVEHINDAQHNGAELLTTVDKSDHNSKLFRPCVLRDVTDQCLVAGEETFGPVAPLFSFDDEDEVIERANNTIFGLAAYFYTKDHARIWRVSEALDYGIVGVNTGLISTPVAPFGGFKQSGLGREGSKYGIEDYLEIKYILDNFD